MNITVYLGANDGDETLREAAKDLGSWIARSNTLVYGGSRTGLMGALATSALMAGGRVIGVEPRFFVESDLQLEGIELIVTETMAERKEQMIRLGDAFIAFPGGTGTLEEVSEVLSRIALGLRAPCILYNLNGYYEGLRTQLRTMFDQGLSSPSRLPGVSFAQSLEEIASLLGSA